MMLRLTHRYPERIILAERDDRNTCLCTDYMWKVHSKHTISGLFEVANLVIFGSEFQISQQSSVRTNETRSITRCFKKTDMLKEMDVSDSWGHVPARESRQLETTTQTKEGESKTCGSERALSIIHIYNHICTTGQIKNKKSLVLTKAHITTYYSVTWSSEIILISWFTAQETFMIIINVETKTVVL